MELAAKSLATPDDKRSFEHGTLNIVNLPGVTVVSGTMQPGWRWSTDVKPIVGTDSCQVPHCGVVLSGRFHVRADDGTELELGPGDAHVVPPGHDAWVVGDEPCTILDFAPATPARDADEEAVRKVIESYFDRLGESDAGAILELFTDDAALMQPDRGVAAGSAMLAAAFEAGFGALSIDETFDCDRILVDGDLASARTSSAGHITIRASGETVPSRHRELFVLERGAGGDWKIAEYMFQSEPDGGQ